MDRHLVSVEVGVEGGADQGVDPDRLAFDQDGVEGLDPQPVEGGGAVEHHRMLPDHLVQNVPDLLGLALDHLLGALDGVDVAELLQAVDDEGLEELERHLLGQAALVELELGADHDHRAAGVVDPLAQEVLAEAPLLPAQVVGEGLQGPLAAPSTGRPWRPLSKRASTASWSIRFSLRTMTSGVLSWRMVFSRLLRLITRR